MTVLILFVYIISCYQKVVTVDFFKKKAFLTPKITTNTSVFFALKKLLDQCYHSLLYKIVLVGRTAN